MVPILSGIIAGQGASVTTRRAFSLSLTYVLGMALTYTVAGARLRLRPGQQAQAIFQQPWIIVLFARAVRRAGAVDVRPLHAADAELPCRRGSSELSNRQQSAAPSAASPSWARCRR